MTTRQTGSSGERGSVSDDARDEVTAGESGDAGRGSSTKAPGPGSGEPTEPGSDAGATARAGTGRARGPAPGRTPRAVWTMILLPPATLGALIFVYAALAGISPADTGAEEAIRAALPGILAVNHLALFGLLVYLLKRAGGTLRDIGWSAEAVGSTVPREVGIGLVCALGLYLFKELAVDPVRQLLAGETPTFTSLFNFRVPAGEVAMGLAAASLVFVEESIYRGYALPFFEKRWGMPAAVLVTSVAFGLLHWGNGPEAILFTTVWGMLVAGVFVWRRNLVVVTVAHAAYNLSMILT